MDDSKQPFRIRRYTASDYESVWTLHNAALHEVGAHLGSGPWDDDLHDIESVYLESGGEFLVGTLAGEIVAMGAVRKTEADRAELKRMRVAPKLQGRGFGQRILRALEERAVVLGYMSLHLDTTVQQIAARRMYEKNGYRETGRGEIGPFECVFFEKEFGKGET